MFYSTKDANNDGMSYELKVFSRLKNTFEDEFSFGINGFPMFYDNGQSFREIDILFIHRTMGVFNIEVKGIKINQIKQIVGHSWKMENFYEDEILPFEQAQQQTYMLKGYLNKSLMLGKKMNIATLIALPEISQAEWEARGFHQQINTPTPIFKDDLESDEALRTKLFSYIKHVKKRPLMEDDWNRLLALFQIEQETELSIQTNVLTKGKQEIQKYNIQLFSKLFIFESLTQFQTEVNTIEHLLAEGIKVYVFDQDEKIRNYCEQRFKPFIDEFQLEIFNQAKGNKKIPFTVIENGVITEKVAEQLAKAFNQFNIGQFYAIHCDANKSEMITAGAGTGKTHVMIDRILYLITVARVNLRDIIMITFTNASTNEMRKRLERKFITLFELTGTSAYLQFAEDVRTMQISTIHSYAKSVIQKLAHELGYGQSIKLRSFTYEKKQIIQSLINQYFENQKVEFFKVHNLKHYNFINFAYALWEEMEKKGLSKNDIEQLDWGMESTNSQHVGELLKFIFSHCETDLELLKSKLNAITMGDLIRKLKSLTGDITKIKQLNQNCFMFVDEFQDSDDVQISFIAELQKLANYKLFVVGDTKQSVYRFRGADYRSFDVLEQKINKNVPLQKLSLRHNYRSSQSILTEMDKLFMAWGKLNPPLLSYSEKTCLISERKAMYKENWIINAYENKTQRALLIKQHIKNTVNSLTDTNKKVALLVRTNFQAKEMKALCDELGLATTENLDGTFYKSLAVKHFKSLLEALLYPNEPKFLVTGIQTPYFRIPIQAQNLVKANGNKSQLNNELRPIKENSILKYIHYLRENSVMAVIQMIISENAVLSHIQNYFIHQDMNEEQAKTEAACYIANLQHLMTLIERNFNQQNLSLHTLINWLSIQMNTNRSENEPILEETSAKITISTVHRSKGLEFDTVILPVTDKQYNYVTSDFHIEDEVNPTKARRIGWQLSSKNGANNITYSNHYFSDLDNVEAIEQQKEEVRLLYVAFTRAEQKVIVLLPKSIQQDTWAALLSKANIKGMMK